MLLLLGVWEMNEKNKSSRIQILKRIGHTITLEHCVIRFIMAWCFVSFLKTIYVLRQGFKGVSSLEGMRFWGFGVHIIIVLALFLAIYALFEITKNVLLEKILLFAVTFSYAVLCVLEYRDIYFCIALTALMAFVVVYVFHAIEENSVRNIKIRDCEGNFRNASKTLSCDIHAARSDMNVHGYRAGLVAAGLLFVAFTGICTAMRYYTYAAPNFDLGLFSQMFHYMKTTLTMNTTCERDMLLSHLRVHLSPVFWLILPFYALFSSPATLQVMQAVFIALGLIPLTLICRNHQFSRFETLLVGICYVTYPVMSGGCFYDIHENLFLPLFLLLLLWFMEKNHTAGMVISAALVFSIKEDAPIYVAFIALYMMAGRKMYKKGAALFGMSVVYFVFATTLLAHIGEGAMVYRFNNMIYEGDGSMLGIVKSVFSNPAYLITQVVRADNIEFILQVFAPLLFLPFFSKKWQRFILFGPLVMFNLMSDYTYFHNIFFQYVFGSGTLLLYVMILNVTDFKQRTRSCAIPMLAVAGVLFFITIMWDKTAYVKRYYNKYNQTIYAQMDEALALIPEEASVTATAFLCPALSNHDILYELYYTDERTEYIALDLRGGTKDYSADTYLNDARYETVYYEPFRIAVFRDRQWRD